MTLTNGSRRTIALTKMQVDEEMKAGAQLFANLKQLLKLYTRQRDKAMMLSIVEEVCTGALPSAEVFY